MYQTPNESAHITSQFANQPSYKFGGYESWIRIDSKDRKTAILNTNEHNPIIPVQAAKQNQEVDNKFVSFIWSVICLPYTIVSSIIRYILELLGIVKPKPAYDEAMIDRLARESYHCGF